MKVELTLSELRIISSALENIKVTIHTAQFHIGLPETRNKINNIIVAAKVKEGEKYITPTFTPPRVPAPPPCRILCEACGPLTIDGKHTGIICRLVRRFSKEKAV